MSDLKHLLHRSAAALLGIVFMLGGCAQDDLKKVATIPAKKVILSRNRSLDVDVIYSDSAVVKARGFAPVYDKVTLAEGQPYNEMPEGVKLEFYDALLRLTGTITSKYAINKEADKITIFRKNVVVVNDAMTFTTEELIWDENKRMYTSTYGTLTTKEGDVVNGTEFSASQDFSSYKIKVASGKGYVNSGTIP